MNKNELNEKNREIKELKKEIETVNKLKEEYKEYYEKMRNGMNYFILRKNIYMVNFRNYQNEKSL